MQLRCKKHTVEDTGEETRYISAKRTQLIITLREINFYEQNCYAIFLVILYSYLILKKMNESITDS